MDTVGWYLASLHQLIGHRAAANFLGVEVEEGEQADCVLCQYENGLATKDDVEQAIGAHRE